MTLDNIERTLPNNQEAERAVLGAVLMNPRALQDAEGVITAADFYRRQHQLLFAQMVALAEKHVEIDFVTLANGLGDHLEEVGGAAYLAALVDGRSRSTNVLYYAGIVREKARLRDLIFGANRMLTRAYDAEDDVVEILAGAERDIVGLADKSIVSGFEAMGSIARRGLDFIEQAYQRRTPVSGVPSGLTKLDDLTRGFQGGTLVTIGARPGVGKSSLLNNITQHAALAGHRAAEFSLEMGKIEIFVRQVASRARVDSHRIQTGFIADREWGVISQAIGELAESSLHIDDTPAVSLLEVRSRARRLKLEHGLDLLAIDYLQLMTPHQRMNNRSLEIGAITAGLKALSMELKIPILIASQLSRDPEKRGGRPKLSDLRDSGSIEQDSDIVMFLHRDEDKPEEPTELILAKHRGGAVGTVQLQWYEQFTRYDDWQSSDAPVDQHLPMGSR